jgi:hypothetical protein
LSFPKTIVAVRGAASKLFMTMSDYPDHHTPATHRSLAKGSNYRLTVWATHRDAISKLGKTMKKMMGEEQPAAIG